MSVFIYVKLCGILKISTSVDALFLEFFLSSLGLLLPCKDLLTVLQAFLYSINAVIRVIRIHFSLSLYIQ